MSYLLGKVKKKKFPIRTYYCEHLEENFYFKRRTLFDEEVILNEANQEAYGGSDSTIYTTAIYLYMSCDKTGKREFKDFTDVEAILPVVEELRADENFSDHFKGAFNFGWFGVEPKDDDLVSDEEGSVAEGKKQSSKADSKG